VNKNSGTVGPTPQELALSANAASEFQRYQSQWLPLQDHLADTISSMAPGADSWQRKEAEGKGSADVAQQFAKVAQQKTVSEMDHGINVGSSAFKLGVTGLAAATAEAKGAAVNTGNEAIDKAYLSGLTSISKAGEGLAGAATQGMGMAADVGSREAISQAQITNAASADKMGLLGAGIGAVAAGMTGPASLTSSFSTNMSALGPAIAGIGSGNFGENYAEAGGTGLGITANPESST
jgi:hypothetical protein